MIKRKDQKPKTNETDYEIESDSPPPSDVSDPIGTYKPRVPYPKLWMHLSLLGKTNYNR